MDPVALLAGVQHQGDACQKQTSLSGSNPKSNLKFQQWRNLNHHIDDTIIAIDVDGFHLNPSRKMHRIGQKKKLH
jgi:hypothetical protein